MVTKMEINSITNGTSALYDQASNKDVGIAVLKKALDSQAASAAALIDSLPKPEKTTSNLPSHLGQNVNTTA